MVASGSRTMIAGSLSSSIAGFHQSCRFSQSSAPRRSCVGIGPAFAATGIGSRVHREGDRKSTRSCRVLIRRMSVENPLWGAPRIHGELLKLGFEVAQSSVAKYMVKRRGPPSQGWRTFLRNHAPDIAAIDLFVVPTIGFDLLYAFVVVRLERRDLVWINVTAHPTAGWIARQITEAFPWNEAPRYLIRDRDQATGAACAARADVADRSGRDIAPGYAAGDFVAFSLPHDRHRHAHAIPPRLPYWGAASEWEENIIPEQFLGPLRLELWPELYDAILEPP